MKSGCGGCLVVLVLSVVAIGVGEAIAAGGSWGGLSYGVAAFGILVALILGAKLMPSGRCDLCGAQLKRAKYLWVGPDGKKKTICPNCNRGIEQRRSKEAVRRALGD